jgi:hypothetical protein
LEKQPQATHDETPQCERCSAPGVYLAGISSESAMDYFACAQCGFVWLQPKRAARKPTVEPT